MLSVLSKKLKHTLIALSTDKPSLCTEIHLRTVLHGAKSCMMYREILMRFQWTYMGGK
jgi:hypothetical protein